FRLLQCLARDGLLDAVRAAARAGAPFVGWSAGAVVARPSIATTNSLPIVELPNLSALELVGFHINAHFTTERPPAGETREDKLRDFLAWHPEARVVCLREGGWLRVVAGQVTAGGTAPVRILSTAGAIDVKPGCVVSAE